MAKLLASYLRYIRGEGRCLCWDLLVPLGLFVGLCSRVRNFAYDHGIASSTEPPVPVVSVGNITHGGTNKTPFVEMLARLFLEAGLTPGIVIRGYGRSGRESLFAGECPQSRDLLGDEALLLSGRLPGVPVAVASEKMTGIDRLASRRVDVALADDGFQHRRMGRDVDIVLVDATCPFGNGHLMPAGMLREPADSLGRAHIVVITKADQVLPGRIDEIKKRIMDISGHAPFLSILELAGWSKVSAGSVLEDSPPPELPVAAFSAIGNPSSFTTFLSMLGVSLLSHESFRDHHRFSLREIEGVSERAVKAGAGALVCTEKDVFNLPALWSSSLPLYVPRVRASICDPHSFRLRLSECLKPRLVVASNGHGEDAIGSLLAEKMKNRFPLAEVSGFSLVGRGREYRTKGIDVASPPSETPSGGVVKYRLKDLLADIRSGLFRHISSQAEAWTTLRGKIRTVLCVGDVYLLLHTLWGQGCKPGLLATAKSTRLHGHWWMEERLLRSRCRRVWTRDPETASSLSGKMVDAVYGGNPIMDLAGDTINRPGPRGEHRVILLPGSRERAYEDLDLLLEAATLVSAGEKCSFVIVLAATIDRDRLLRSAPDWVPAGKDAIRHPSGSPEVMLFSGDVAEAASRADILIGLGGTANQICAGLGIPVVSVDEKGKRVQKKLLGDAESLVPADPESLAEEAIAILRDPARRERMANAGRVLMGAPGALEAIIEYASVSLGWEKRCRVYQRFSSICKVERGN